jgi:hypothetical protein
MKLTHSQATDAVRIALRRSDRSLTPAEISSAVGFDIGPYRNILGPLEANSEIELIGARVQWKQESFEVVTGEPLG